MIPITIDGIDLTVSRDITILEAAKSLGINIPSLCFHPDLKPQGLCRVCMVEIEECNELVAACTYHIVKPIKVLTNSPKIREVREVNLSLILSKHRNHCTTCVRNGNCELQNLSEQYISKEIPFSEQPYSSRVDNLSASIFRDYSKCILCRRCISTCQDIQGIGLYGPKYRGNRLEIGTFNHDSLENSPCTTCGQCINRCPTAALYEVECRDDVWKEILNPHKYVVIQTAPAPRAAIGESFGYTLGRSYTYELNTALKKMGFNRVFDTCFTADLTVIEEGLELLLRVKNRERLPLFTSCSPGWVKYIEYNYPDMLENLSSAKSPHEMFGALLKTYYSELINIDPANMVVVSLMPCTAKKSEIIRPELRDSGYQDVDYVLTTREIAKMINEIGLDLKSLPETEFDNPFGDETGSGVIFGSTGGVMESALRTLFQVLTGDDMKELEDGTLRGFEGVKYSEISIEKTTKVPELFKKHFKDFHFLEGEVLKVAVCHGTDNAHKVLEDIRQGGLFSHCHFIEFMACAGGCIGGGGQPIPVDKSIREKRKEAICFRDNSDYIRISAQNPSVQKIYREYLNDTPGGDRARELLHSYYYKSI